METVVVEEDIKPRKYVLKFLLFWNTKIQYYNCLPYFQTKQCWSLSFNVRLKIYGIVDSNHTQTQW